MIVRPWTVQWLLLAAALALAGCASRGGVSGGSDGFPDQVPPDIASIPDAVPVPEPRSRYGNPGQYDVLGKRYFVLGTADGYRERGHASWYGTKFHGRRTSSGEPYDMFAMTAAHKTLPLPSYVRVTHLGNGRSVVVKVNDRGPFHEGRIIDLSYAAATKLGLLKDGSAEVEVETLSPGALPPPSLPVARFIEVGGATDPIQAVSLREMVMALGITPVEIRTAEREDGVWHRVLAGPFRDAASYQAASARLLASQLPVNPVQE